MPELKIYEEIQNPDTLVRQLNSKNTWKEGIPILRKIQSMIKKYQNKPISFPAKYIELAGDWCRKHNQPSLALSFYNEAIQRDPERISSQVELYSLKVEYDASTRKKSLNQLYLLSNSGMLNLRHFKRIFNALLEIDDYHELKKLTLSLIKQEKFKDNNKALALFYRNLSRANRNISGYLTNEAWENIQKAYELTPNGENVLVIYVTTLLEDKKEYEKSLKYAKKLLKMDPSDTRYYRIIAEIYLVQDQYEKAMAILKNAEKISSTYKDVYYNKILMQKINNMQSAFQGL